MVYLILKVIAVKQLTHTHREGKGQNDCWEDMKHFQGTPLFGRSSSGNATATDWGEGQHCCPLLLCCVLRFQISVNNWLVVFLWEWTILPHFLVGFIPTQSKGPWLCSLCCLLLTRARTACILLGFCSPTVTCSPPSTQHGNKQLCPAHHMELQEGKKSPHVDRNKGCATHTCRERPVLKFRWKSSSVPALRIPFAILPSQHHSTQ